MEIEFDSDKNQRNIEIRGIDFSIAVDFDFDNALEVDQVVSGELRHFALGFIGNRLHALVYTMRGETIRVISLRKANKREARLYGQTS